MGRYGICFLSTMNYTLFGIVFTLCLFMYVHVKYQRKVCPESNTITMPIDSKAKLDEVTDVRLPTKFPNHFFPEVNAISLADIAREWRDPIDVNVLRAAGGGEGGETEGGDEGGAPGDGAIPVPLNLEDALVLFEGESAYVTERNADAAESIFGDALREREFLIRPTLTVRSGLDLLAGSPGAKTRLQHHIQFRNYVFVTSGSVQFRFVHPKHLPHCLPDFDHGEKVYAYAKDVWGITEGQRRLHKVQFLSMDARAGDVVYIPPLWGYSIRYGEPNTMCVRVQYHTLMNVVAYAKEHFLSLLQKKNTHIRTPLLSGAGASE
jgi:hypothetical protein